MIVVSGMHRSGTSLVALVLRELGLDFGPESAMYEADDWNVRGYLERADVVDINSKAITGFDRTTGKVTQVASQASYLVQSIRGRPTQSVRRLQPSADRISAIGDELGSMAVKDPRFCLTYGGWAHLTSTTGLVVALRHPTSSVASLERRNRIPAPLGHRFWRWHMNAILPHIDSQTLVLHQESLVGDGLEECVDRAGRWLAERGISATGNARSVVDSGLVHHRADDAGAPAASLALWQKLNDQPSFR